MAFRKTIYTSVEQLQRDVDDWIDEYNCKRPHSGRYCYGKTPMQTFIDSQSLVDEKMVHLQFDDRIEGASDPSEPHVEESETNQTHLTPFISVR